MKPNILSGKTTEFVLADHETRIQRVEEAIPRLERSIEELKHLICDGFDRIGKQIEDLQINIRVMSHQIDQLQIGQQKLLIGLNDVRDVLRLPPTIL